MIRDRRAPRPDRSEEFASYVAPRPSVRMATPHDLSVRVVDQSLDVKVPDKERPKLRESARDEDCLIRLPGCPQRRDMTILSHCRHWFAGKGMATKAHDLLTAYGCTHCDAIYDGQAPLPAGWAREMVELEWWRAHAQTILRMAQKGLL